VLPSQREYLNDKALKASTNYKFHYIAIEMFFQYTFIYKNDL